MFRDYQWQAACGEIQFRRWPLRAVSLLAFYLYHIGILTPTSTNVWFYVVYSMIPSNGSLTGRGQLLSNYFSQNSTAGLCCLFPREWLTKFDILCSRRSVPGTLLLSFRMTNKTDARAVYWRCRAHNPAGGRRQGSARCAGIDQASYRDSSGKRSPFQRSPERRLYGKAENGGK